MQELFEKICSGYRLNHDQAVELADSVSVVQLCELADRLRIHFQSNFYETCSIMNARSGLCPEDCKWCSQSCHHSAKVDIYPLVNVKQAVEMALMNAHQGVGRFSLVTSGRGMSDDELMRACELFRAVGSQSNIKLCASMGLLDPEQMRMLAGSGVVRYHCNLESAPSHFSSLCTTHTIAQKIAVLDAARSVGMEICSGGIIGMGESRRQRIELAITLRDLEVDSIPLNILNPIDGTPMEGAEPLPDDEILLTAAMFRIINPKVHLRLAGGRVRVAHLLPRLLHCGVSAAIVGDMLTTIGSQVESDVEMFESEGLIPQGYV